MGAIASGTAAPAAGIDDQALREAAEWRVRLDDAPDPGERAAFERWRASHPEHERAWRSIAATWEAFAPAARPGTRGALEQTFNEERRERRRWLRRGTATLALLVALVPAVWMAGGLPPPAHLLADHHTAIGERRIIALPDGSRLVLSTATAVDIDFDKVLSCVKRGVPVYQGDANEVLAGFQDNAFDRVIFSRTVEQFDAPDATLREGLRVGKRATVGFVNHGFWKNRLNKALWGRRTINEVYPNPWYASMPANPFPVVEFEDYCKLKNIEIGNRVYLAGDWRSECSLFPNMLAGYAIYDLASSC